jgi:hypothetical protein
MMLTDRDRDRRRDNDQEDEWRETRRKLQGTGWETVNADDEPPRRLIVAVDGMEKEGKTHFSLTGPRPIGHLDIDIGGEGMVEKFAEKGGLFRSVYRFETTSGNKQKIADEADVVWRGVKKDYYAGLKAFRTMCVDTGTESWELIRLARFGALDQVLPEFYGPVNREFSRFMRAGYSHNCNVLFTHKLKPEYERTEKKSKYAPAKLTGRLKRAGWGDTGFTVQVNVTAYREEGEFKLRIDSCRQNAGLDGMELEGPLVSFANLATLVFPKTRLRDWR